MFFKVKLNISYFTIVVLLINRLHIKEWIFASFRFFLHSPPRVEQSVISEITYTLVYVIIFFRQITRMSIIDNSIFFSFTRNIWKLVKSWNNKTFCKFFKKNEFEWSSVWSKICIVRWALGIRTPKPWLLIQCRSEKIGLSFSPGVRRKQTKEDNTGRGEIQVPSNLPWGIG